MTFEHKIELCFEWFKKPAVQRDWGNVGIKALNTNDLGVSIRDSWHIEVKHEVSDSGRAQIIEKSWKPQ